MNYKLPQVYYTSWIKQVVRNSYTREKKKRNVFWEYSSLSLASYNEETGIFLAIKLEEDDLCLNFLPPNNSVLRIVENQDFLFEMDRVQYESISEILKRCYKQSEIRERYKIKEASDADIMRCIKDKTSGKITIKKLSPLSTIPFRRLDILSDRIELRTYTKDALLIIPFRNISFFRKGKREIKNLLDYIK